MVLERVAVSFNISVAMRKRENVIIYYLFRCSTVQYRLYSLIPTQRSLRPLSVLT